MLLHQSLDCFVVVVICGCESYFLWGGLVVICGGLVGFMFACFMWTLMSV